MAGKITLALNALKQATEHVESLYHEEEEVEPVPLQHETAMGAVITATPNGNCLEIDVPEGFQINFQMSRDYPGRKMWIWVVLEPPEF